MIRNLMTMAGASLATILVASAIGVIGASATTSGHFTTNAPSGQVKLDITESTETTDRTTWNAFGTSISCHKVNYAAPNLTSSTVSTITITPEYANCTTGSEGSANIKMNGCHYSFASRTEGHGTVKLICATGKKVEVESGAGTMKFAEQTPKGGAVYTTIDASGLHALTIDLTAEGLTGECHGACQIFGTNNANGKLTGSVTVVATEVAEPFVGITAT
jgi:hypothetical protein